MARSTSRHSVPGDRVDLRHVLRASVAVLTVLLSVSILVAFGYGWKKYGDLNSNIPKFKISALGQAPAPAKGANPVKQKNGSSQNILIVGLDTREGLTQQQVQQYHTGNDVSDSTDSIMVVHVPADGSKATLISVPREVYVDIPGYKQNLINAAYADGKDVGGTGTLKQREAEGFNLLVQTVSQLTGLTINHFVAVGFAGFVNIANAIHGVEVNLCYAQNDPYSGLDVPAGPQRLSGAEALAFVRQRHNINGGDSSDLTRAQRQRYFLAAAFKQVESIGVLTSPSRLDALISAIDGSFYIDDTLNLVSLAEQMADLTTGNIIGHAIPTQGDVTTIEGQDGLAVDPATVQAQIQQWLNPPTPAPSSSSSSSKAGSSGASSSGSPSPASSSASAALTPGCIH